MRMSSQSGNVLAACLFLVGCSATEAAPPDAAVDRPNPGAELLAARPYQTYEPAGYDPQRPAPLVLLLHGYGSSGALQKLYFGLEPLADSARFLLAYPDGSEDKQGSLYWNATDACCDIYGSKVDDVAYLRAVLADMKRRYKVDPARVFVVGHSNGGFMAYRLACELSDEIAGIVSLAGAAWNDPGRCHPTSPVSVLQVHGDADDVIRYDGGATGSPLAAPYPSAHATVAAWAASNHCSGSLADTGDRLDLASDPSGAETRVERYGGCPQAAVELWTLAGAGHIPPLRPAFGTSIYDFLQAHPKSR